jgi:hypothetical protein
VWKALSRDYLCPSRVIRFGACYCSSLSHSSVDPCQPHDCPSRPGVPGRRSQGAAQLVVLCELSTFAGVDDCERKDRDHHGGERAE